MGRRLVLITLPVGLIAKGSFSLRSWVVAQPARENTANHSPDRSENNFSHFLSFQSPPRLKGKFKSRFGYPSFPFRSRGSELFVSINSVHYNLKGVIRFFFSSLITILYTAFLPRSFPLFLFFGK